LTGRWLFNPEEGETWSKDDDHLAKMMELTGDHFSPEVLQQCKDAADFFDEEGTRYSHCWSHDCH
jgi:serine/threonine-protein kinase SRPK3